MLAEEMFETDSRAKVYEEFDVTEHRDLLLAGRNVLAVHGLNRRANDGDMLIVPEIAISSAAKAELTVSETTLVRARILNEGEWSPLTEALFTVDSGLRLTEIMYHPLEPRAFELEAGHDDQDDFEFLELANTGAASINLNGYRFTDGLRFEFGDLTVAPGEHVVVVSDRSAFETRYPPEANGIRIAGEYEGNLANGGEAIALTDPGGFEVLRFRYDDGWYPKTDGDGYSLVLADAQGEGGLDDPGRWRPSREKLGSPGQRE